jgi:soluble lytic murein transglycosylase-like protein
LLVLFIAGQLHAAEMANLRNGFSIRHQRHEVVGANTRLYLGDTADAGYMDIPSADIESFEPAPPEPTPVAVTSHNARDLSSIVSDASDRSQVDADLIASVIHAESADNPHAVSPKGAQGLMQLMPGTATQLGVKDSFDPADNVDGGVRYLRQLLLLYNNDMVKALAAYNAGPQRVQQYHGVPPYRETRAYVARVITDYNRKKLAQQRRNAAATTQVARKKTPASKTKKTVVAAAASTADAPAGQ